MKPTRVHNFGTYFVTAATWERRSLFGSDPWAKLFLKTLYEYRATGKYLLHEFVLMPDHFHLITTPLDVPLERALQFIKGGFFSEQAESWLPRLRSGRRDSPITVSETQQIMIVAENTF